MKMLNYGRALYLVVRFNVDVKDCFLIGFGFENKNK